MPERVERKRQVDGIGRRGRFLGEPPEGDGRVSEIEHRPRDVQCVACAIGAGEHVGSQRTAADPDNRPRRRRQVTGAGHVDDRARRAEVERRVHEVEHRSARRHSRSAGDVQQRARSERERRRVGPEEGAAGNAGATEDIDEGTGPGKR